MGRLIKVFKPSQSAVLVFQFMICFGLLASIAGVFAHVAMLTCAGITVLTLFAALLFRQPSESIELHDDLILFKQANQVLWKLPLSSVGGLEIATSLKNVSIYSPGRTILLRFMDLDGKLCAEANVNAYDKEALKNMVELISLHRDGLTLNRQAQQMLQLQRSQGHTIEAVTKTE